MCAHAKQILQCVLQIPTTQETVQSEERKIFNTTNEAHAYLIFNSDDKTCMC